ncbi:MAG: SPOR domain-containing protein [Gaiellaceae bacterium MAG52_C11]|nr:SPOR domain-containing protein [Candidatus Gaiellasilicea maunaloa]
MSRTSKQAERRRETAAASKQRRQKVIAFGGLGVLALLLVIQGPKLMKLVGDGSTAVAAPAPGVPGTALPAAAPPERKQPTALLVKGGGADPFQVRSLRDLDPQAADVSAPNGSRDPFRKSAAATFTPAAAPPPARLPGRIVVGTPTPDAVAKRGWIVVLASVRNGVGRAYAERFASRANGRGLSASVLDSSTRKTLRSGYYVVYTGPYATVSAVRRASGRAHASGYSTAYIREILRY